MIYVLKVTNHYNICSVVREILTIAALITLIALGIFPIAVIIPCVVIGGLTAMYSYQIHKTKREIAECEAELAALNSIVS